MEDSTLATGRAAVSAWPHNANPLPTMQMHLLHTSDWHLGRALYGRKRYEEFAAFLDWLADTIERERIDVLLDMLDELAELEVK